MAKTSGLGANFYIAGYDLSGDIGAIDTISGGPALIDVTPINVSANVRIGGLRSGDLQFTTYFDPAAAQEHTALSSLPRTDVIAMALLSTTLGQPATAINGKQLNYDWTRDNTGGLTGKVEVQSNSFGLEWGKNLTGNGVTGLRTDTTATTGAAFDDGAASSFGGQAYFMVTAFTGTSVTIDIQSATTSGGSYTTTGLTSSAFTGIGAQRVAIANNVTINEFLKVVTTGTFSNAKFAVVFVRNPVAVVF